MTVQKLLGHSSVKMTERYTHTSDEQKRKAVDLLHIRYMEKEESPVIPLFSVN